MTRIETIEGAAAPLMIANLDTDQIMPKEFLKGIDKSGLRDGVLRDLRYDLEGVERGEFVLSRPGYRTADILVGGENFGCGSSREHAVWGLLQFGIRAVVAPSFGEIFFNNAMNNLLLLAAVPPDDVERLASDISDPEHNRMSINLRDLTVTTSGHRARFSLGARHQRMFLDGTDLIDYSLSYGDDVTAFLAAYWERHPWRRDAGRIPYLEQSRGPGD